MLTWFDRLQFKKDENSNEENLIIFEFFETSTEKINMLNKDNWWDGELAHDIFDEFTYEKHQVIRNLMKKNNKIIYYLIFYNNNDNDEKKVFEYTNSNNLEVISYANFWELREWFLEVNNSTDTIPSKPLGGLETETDYARKLLIEYWKEKMNPNDDQGRLYTEKMLTVYEEDGQVKYDTNGNTIKYNTYGFDFDLVIYNEESNFLSNIELAYNNKPKSRANRFCGPMNYCWGYGLTGIDNTQKYNNLWKATKYLKGTFSVLNYTDENNEENTIDNDFKLILINSLDYKDGITNEVVYIIEKSKFEEALLLTENDYSKFEESAKNSVKHYANYMKTVSENRRNQKKALQMLKKKIPIDKIMEETKFTIDDIKRLKKKISIYYNK